MNINEEELTAVTGGATQNRHDPAVCRTRREATQSCWGFLGTYWCDHYRRKKDSNESNAFQDVYKVECAMGYFKYDEIKPLDPSI